MKILKKTLSIVLILSILCSCVICFYANATSNAIHESCVKEHFDFIQAQAMYPDNSIGNCAYTAMSLMLSFYDAYWDDRFVPINYESPGRININTGYVLNEFHFMLENADWQLLVNQTGLVEGSRAEKEAYASFIQDNKDDYFQLYLIDLGIQEGYHNNELIYGLKSYEMVDFLEFYLYDICGFNSNQITVRKMREIDGYTNEDIFDVAKQQIKNGFPVIYGGGIAEIENIEFFSSIQDNIGKHAFLAYDLTPNEDDIILSYCWNGESTTTFYTTEYRYFSSIIWLEINYDALPHTCSDSYQDLSGNSYCTCDIYNLHSLHNHQYNIESYSSTHHWMQCTCGVINQYEAHIPANVSSDTSKHSFSCECGFSISDQLHTYEYTYISQLSHRCVCAICGYSKSRMHTTQTIDNRYSYCTGCGHVFDAWSDPIIKTEIDIPPESE